MNAPRTTQQMSALGMRAPMTQTSEQYLTETGSSRYALGTRIETLGECVLRYGLALVIVWIGFMKFTAYEAGGFSPSWQAVRSRVGCTAFSPCECSQPDWRS